MEIKEKGFTLIEIIVVVGILGIIAVVGSGSFFSILRSSTKTKTLQLVKQNGDYALSVMERMIRNARKINASAGDSLEIVNPDGMKTVFSCTDNKIASNGASLISNEVKVEDCSAVFTVTPGETNKPPVVKISFDLRQSADTTRIEEKNLINFQTTVVLRNY